MKISSANKTTPAPPSTTVETIFEKSVDTAPSPVDLVDVEIITGDSDNLSSGRVEIAVSSLNETLVAAGFETVELVVEEKSTPTLPASATPAEINDFFNQERDQQKAFDEKTITIDLKQNVDNNKLNNIASNNLNIVEDDEDIELSFVKSANTSFDF